MDGDDTLKKAPLLMLNLKSLIHTVLSVLESCADCLNHRLCKSLRCGEGGQFCCSSNAPPEVVSELQQRRAGVCVNGNAGGVDQGYVGLMDPSLIIEKGPAKQYSRTKQQLSGN